MASSTTTAPKQHNAYGPGHEPSQVQHHAWRTAENSAAHLLPHLQRAAAANPALRMLDVGAGPGTISASLARYFPQGQLVATDISESILARAREHADAQGVANIEFCQADVFALPFADEEFDVVHAHQVLCHLDEPAEAVREMLRVTKPGGLVALREADMRMWCVWPEIPGLLRFYEVLVRTLVANGGQEKGGRQLLAWVLEAGGGEGGVRREDVEVGFSTQCYSKLEDRRMWGESMISRLKTGQMRSKGIEMGITTAEDIDEMIKAWEEWMATDSATLGIMNGEVVVQKRG